MQLNFDPTQNYGASATHEPLPVGNYTAVITGCEQKQAKSNPANAYLELSLSVVGGTHADRRIWSRLNLWNQNQMSVEIAQRTLQQICIALGITRLGDSSELLNKPLQIVVGQDRRDPNNTEIRRFMKVQGVQAAPAPAAPARSAAPAEKMPWE